jgi:hypothetical protein
LPPLFFYPQFVGLAKNEFEHFSIKRATLLIIGHGVFGELKCNHAAIDFNDILIDTLTEQDITIYNPSDCDVHYTLEMYKRKIDELEYKA